AQGVLLFSFCKERLDEDTSYDDREATNENVPQESDVGEVVAIEHEDLGDDGSDEHGSAAYPLQVERSYENAQKRSEKKRTHNVDELYKVLGEAGQDGKEQIGRAH